MTPDQNLLDLKQREAIALRRFDPRSATPFANKSVPEETRRAYRKAVGYFYNLLVEGILRKTCTALLRELLPK